MLHEISIFDAELRENKLVIKVLQNPNTASEAEHCMKRFFVKHEKLLKQIEKDHTGLCFFDIRILELSACTTMLLSDMVKHFVNMKDLSERKLRACSVCVSSDFIAAMVQGYIDLNPGKIPTFVNTSPERCQGYLRQFSSAPPLSVAHEKKVK